MSDNRFSGFSDYGSMSGKFHKIVNENKLLSFNELTTIIEKLNQFYPDPGSSRYAFFLGEEILEVLSRPVDYSSFFGWVAGQHPAQLPLIVDTQFKLVSFLEKINGDPLKEAIYVKYFKSKFPTFDLNTVCENRVPVITINQVQNNPVNTNEEIEEVLVEQRPSIPALVAQVFTERKQEVVDSFSNLTEEEQLQLLNGVLHEVHNKRLTLPVGFFSSFSEKNLDLSHELGILSSVVSQHKEEEALSEFYDILSEASKVLLITELVSHAEGLSNAMLAFCVKNWSDSVSFNVNGVLTMSTFGGGQQESIEHPLIAFLSKYGEKINWDSEIFNVSYQKVPVELYYLLTTVLRDCAYQDHIVLGYSEEYQRIISIDAVLNEENFSTEDSAKILACETSFVWMSSAWHEKAIASLWTYIQSFDFDAMILQDVFFKQLDKVSLFESRLLLLASFLKQQSQAVSNSVISFSNFQYFLLSTEGDDQNKIKALKLMVRYAKLSVDKADDFSTFIRTYLHPESAVIHSHYYAIFMLHLVKNVSLDFPKESMCVDDQRIWDAICQYVEYFQKAIKAKDFVSYDQRFRQATTAIDLGSLLKHFKGRMSTPQDYLDVIVFVENASKSGDSVDMNTIRGLLYGKLAVCLQQMILKNVDKKFTFVCFLVACCQASSDPSIGYTAYNRAVGVSYQNQDDDGDDARSVFSSTSRLTSFTNDTNRTKKTQKTDISKVSQPTFYTQQSSSQNPGLRPKF